MNYLPLDGLNYLNYRPNEGKSAVTACLLDEILIKIFLNLEFHDISNCTTACKKWSLILENPEFLHEWLRRHHADIFNSCEKLPKQSREFYEKSFLGVAKINKIIAKKKREQRLFTDFNVAIMIISSPVILTITAKFFLLVCDQFPLLPQIIVYPSKNRSVIRIQLLLKIVFAMLVIL